REPLALAVHDAEEGHGRVAHGGGHGHQVVEPGLEGAAIEVVGGHGADPGGLVGRHRKGSGGVGVDGRLDGGGGVEGGGDAGVVGGQAVDGATEERTRVLEVGRQHGSHGVEQAVDGVHRVAPAGQEGDEPV